jgi:hypothetical protein
MDFILSFISLDEVGRRCGHNKIRATELCTEFGVRVECIELTGVPRTSKIGG